MGNKQKRKQRRAENLDPEILAQASLLTIRQFCVIEPAYTEGGVRWRIFNDRDKKLERSGAVVRDGRRIRIRRDRFIAA